MNILGNGPCKKLRCLLGASVVAFGLMTILATGGGGGGAPPPPIVYTGPMTMAVVDRNNAEELATGAYLGGQIGMAMDSRAVIQLGYIGRPRSWKVIQVLEDSIGHIDMTSVAAGASYRGFITSTETFFCGCGGSVTYNISINDITGEFTGTMTFSSCCEDGVTGSGQTDFSGLLDISASPPVILRFSFNFNYLGFSSGNDSFAVSGNVSYDFQISPYTATIDMRLRENATGSVFWINNFNLSLAEGPGYKDVHFSGRFYDPAYGYVDIYTDPMQAFRIFDGDEWPSEGLLIVEGDTGTGLIATATLTAYPPPPDFWYEVNCDEDGDGTPDFNSGQLFWR
jgi:hypothetical protein